MGKVYRTANGGKVDLGALLLSQENTRSVGNMGVNARGDKIDSHNEVIETRNEIVQKQYNKAHSSTVTEAPVPTSTKHAQEIAGMAPKAKPVAKKAQPKAKEVNEEILPVQSQEPALDEIAQPIVQQVEQPEVVSIPKDKVQGGLAAAIAKAKQIKEEERKTPRQQEQEKKGVTKL